MRRSQLLFIGMIATFAFAWFGLAVAPQLQLGNLQPQADEEGTDVYPIDSAGMAAQGRHVYAANGCFYCHSQQVRDKHYGWHGKSRRRA